MMVTDRRRLGAAWEDALLERVRLAVDAGVQFVQVREPDLEAAGLYRLVCRCMVVLHGSATRLVVNDRTDIAVAAGAHGVHLPGTGPPAARLRSLLRPGAILGRSVHDVRGAATAVAEGADYLLFGTVFSTASKPGRPAAGTAALESVVRATLLPVLAVGGVTADRAAEVAATGAAGFAGIGLFMDGSSADARRNVHQAIAAFDTLPEFSPRA